MWKSGDCLTDTVWKTKHKTSVKCWFLSKTFSGSCADILESKCLVGCLVPLAQKDNKFIDLLKLYLVILILIFSKLNLVTRFWIWYFQSYSFQYHGLRNCQTDLKWKEQNKNKFHKILKWCVMFQNMNLTLTFSLVSSRSFTQYYWIYIFQIENWVMDEPLSLTVQSGWNPRFVKECCHCQKLLISNMSV